MVNRTDARPVTCAAVERCHAPLPAGLAGADASLAAALGVIVAERDIHCLFPLTRGGTPAQVWRAVNSAGDWMVIKYLHATAGMVDGHDLPTFKLKQQQISRIHADLPRLSPHYVRVTGEWHGADWGACAMPFYDGAHAGELLRGQNADVPAFLSALRGILQTLTEHGYAARDWPARLGHFRATHLGRVRRRLPLLRSHLDPRLLDGPGVWVNGRRRPPLQRLLDRLDGDPELIADLEPARLQYPVHGDLNLGNLVIRRNAEFTLLDPRGVLEPWDVVYDMAKILFSLTLFEPAMEGGFAITSDRCNGSPRYLLGLRRPRPAYFAAAAALPGLLGSLPFFRQLDRTDPSWRRRLTFTHALHCVAEAACRISDRKATADGQATHLERAYGLLLTGLCLLDDLLADAGDAGLGALKEIACPHPAEELCPTP